MPYNKKSLLSLSSVVNLKFEVIIKVIKVFVIFCKEVIPNPDILLGQLKIAYNTGSLSQDPVN